MHLLKLAPGPVFIHVTCHTKIETPFTRAHVHLYSFSNFSALITIEMYREYLVAELQGYPKVAG